MTPCIQVILQLVDQLLAACSHENQMLNKTFQLLIAAVVGGGSVSLLSGVMLQTSQTFMSGEFKYPVKVLKQKCHHLTNCRSYFCHVVYGAYLEPVAIVTKRCVGTLDVYWSLFSASQLVCCTRFYRAAETEVPPSFSFCTELLEAQQQQQSGNEARQSSYQHCYKVY